MIRITNFRHGARGLRAMWLCEEMGLSYEVKNLEYPTPESYRAKNPTGSVPYLEDGETGINESTAMLIYLAERYGPTPLLPPRDDPAFARAIQTTVFGEATLGAHLNVLLTLKFGAPEEEKRAWMRDAQQARVTAALAYVSQMLGREPYLCGQQFTIGDISVGTALSLWSGVLGNTLTGSLVEYQKRLNARPAYAKAVERSA